MQKPFDLSKFRTALLKALAVLVQVMIQDWISTGNYTLNYLIRGDFNKGIPSR